MKSQDTYRVPAAVVDKTIADVLPLLEAGDTLIDGGNSYYVDVGTSGGAISQTARGFSSFFIRSANDEAPIAPSLARSWTAFGNTSKTVQRRPALKSRRTMLAPIRPNPTIPSCIGDCVFIRRFLLVSFSGEIILFPCGRYGLSQKLRRTP
jgi:hypothetical protein